MSPKPSASAAVTRKAVAVVRNPFIAASVRNTARDTPFNAASPPRLHRGKSTVLWNLLSLYLDVYVNQHQRNALSLHEELSAKVSPSLYPPLLSAATCRHWIVLSTSLS